MAKFSIITDACSDLPADIAEQFNIISVPMSVTVNNSGKIKDYLLNIDSPAEEFEDIYSQLKNGADVSTAAINTVVFEEYMEKELSEGRDVLCIVFSSALSLTFQNSELAVRELTEKYPERKVYAVDSRAASMGEGLLVYLTALERENGKTIDETKDFVEKMRDELCHWFTVDDLKWLHKGGRISKATQIAGSLMNIKPVLAVDLSGHLVPNSKARGIKNAVRMLADKLNQQIREPAGQTIFISHAQNLERANELADIIRAEHPEFKQILINSIGPTIGIHSGPGTIALFFTGEKVK